LSVSLFDYIMLIAFIR